MKKYEIIVELRNDYNDQVSKTEELEEVVQVIELCLENGIRPALKDKYILDDKSRVYVKEIYFETFDKEVLQIFVGLRPF